MPEFSFSERIPSCRVDKDLISSLEQYLIHELPRRFQGAEQLRVEYSLSITDGVGTEVFDSIKEFVPQLLPDSTQKIAISWTNGYLCNPRVTVRLAFSRSYFLSTFEVTATGDHAREIALAIRDRIKKIIEPHRTLNWVFDPFGFPLASSMAGLLSWIAAVWAVTYYFGRDSRTALLWGVISVVAGWYWLGSKLMPVILFDSRAQARLSGIWRWLSLGFITFVMFTSLMTLIRRKLLGF